MDEYIIQPGHEFGEATLELMSEEYEDLESALIVMSQASGVDPEYLIGLIEGEYVPTEDLVEAIASVFETTQDEDALTGYMYLGYEARYEAGFESDVEDEDEDYEYEYEDEIENEYEDEEDEYEEEVVSAAYSRTASRVRELEDTIAEFQAASIVKDTLAQIERKATNGVTEGWLPPVAKRVLLGAFEREDDRVAAFSQACESNGVDLDSQLFAINYALEVFERCGPVGLFSRMVDEPLTPREAEFQANADTQARLNFELYRQERG